MTQDPVARLEQLLSDVGTLSGAEYHHALSLLEEAAVNALPALLRVAKAAQRYRELIPTEPDDYDSEEYVKWDKDTWEVEEELDAALDALKEAP